MSEEDYRDRISTMAFDLLLLKLEIEEKNREITDLMRDKVELACELAQVVGS